ncbi:MAG TPA: hypothetical protein PKB14_20505 [Rubrivivax sp.]|nr:hypothetical protein [Rubrivivax sp.]
MGTSDAAAAEPKRAPRKLGGTFLAGAKSRLLPASVVFRFFGAAVVFHALAWAALLGGAAQWPLWRHGLGWPLAALHLVTLGTLLCSAIGASLQLLPVATRQPVRSQRLAAALWWLYVPGVAILTVGMGLARPVWLAAGATAVLAALALWAVLLGLNLRGARGMAGVVLHGWGALAALAALGLSAAALVALWLGRPWLDAGAARSLHLVSGAFGVMGLLAFGLAYILLPMFALAGVPGERAQLAAGAAALAAVAAGALAAFAEDFGFAPQPLRVAALLAGVLAWGLHLRLMQRVLATGMRRDLGRGLRLMQLGWACLGLALMLGLALVLGAPADALGRLFGVALVGGWLLSFLLGVLQRILPFLASMHAAKGQRRPPTPSALTLERPLTWHFGAHGAALALLAAAALSDQALLAAAAGAVGLGGALAFAAFFAVLMRRLAQATAGPAEAGRQHTRT